MASKKSSLFFYTVLTNIRGAADSISKCKVMLFFYNRISSIGFYRQFTGHHDKMACHDTRKN